MKRTVICVDAGYLFAQGSVALAGAKQPRAALVLDAKSALTELQSIAKIKAPHSVLLRTYWYDGSLGRPSLEQDQLAHLDDVKVRLGFVNSVGQQKGVDSLIVTDLIELARLGAVCDAVLMSGDEDVRVGVQIAQNYGVRVHLVGISPSRGSQSKALLQEADTTTEWDKATVAKFLAIRSVQAVATPTTIAGHVAITPPTPVGTVPAAPAETARLEKVVNELVGSLNVADINSLMAYWATQRGIPPEFDGKLLGKSRSELNRDLDETERRFVRRKFGDAVRAKS